eukprot:gene27698-7340_t
MQLKRLPVSQGTRTSAPHRGLVRPGARSAVRPRAAAPSKPSEPGLVPEVKTPAHAPHPFKAQLDFRFFKENLELVTANATSRNSVCDPAKVVELYDEYLSLKQSADELRAKRNENSSAMKGKMEPEKRQELIQRGSEIKEEVQQVEEKLGVFEMELQREGQRIPNLTHPEVPIGGEEVARVYKEVGEQRKFEFPLKDHVAIAEALDLVDFESASEVSGAKFYYLRNAAALLEMALINWAFSKTMAKGFTPISTPDIVKSSVLEKCGFQPRGNQTQIYNIEDTSLCLTGTAEVPLGGIYMDKILTEAQLPIKMAAFGHCFRTEAGAAGAAGKGLYRVHQFSKVEMFVICTPEQSDALHQELVELEEQMYTELGFHFKILDMPSEDLGAPAYRKFDVEAWMPGLNRYGEISSASNCTDYQSRRLNIRYRPTPPKGEEPPPEEAQGGTKKKKSQSGKTEFVHTLNATACAVPRMLITILENFQQEDGSVIIPEVLRPFLGGMAVIEAPVKA